MCAYQLDNIDFGGMILLGVCELVSQAILGRSISR